jgi:tetratricopeptide (TPR) repeat protein
LPGAKKEASFPGQLMTDGRNSNAPAAWWRREWLGGLLLVIAVLAAYVPAWNGQPVWDDDSHITRPELRSVSGLERIWVEPGATQQYYPLVHSAFWVEHRIWGDAPAGYHLVNILMHAFAALLLLKILRQLQVPGAWLAAAIFALHPVEVESVAWISELKNTLSAVFYFSAALAYLKFDRTRTPGAYAAAFMLFFAGLTAKTVIATLPAALLVVRWWQRGKLDWKHDVLPLLPFFAAGIIGGLFTASVEREFIGAQGRDFDFSPVDRVLIAGRAFWFYPGKLFWPARLTFIYPRWHLDPGAVWQYLFPLAAVLLLAGLVVLARRHRAPLAAVLFFAISLFPALGFFNVYPFFYSFVADHFQYLASAGIITLAAAGAARWLGRRGLWGNARGNALCLLLLLGLGVLTWRQSAMYANAETLWRTTLARNPGCFMAHNNLAEILFQKGQADEAIAELQKALAIKPDAAKSHYNLGNFLLRKGSVDEAIAELQKALAIEPGDAAAIDCLGSAYLQKGDENAAAAQFERALAVRPDYIEAYVRLGALFMKAGRLDDAAGLLNKAVGIQPDSAAAQCGLGQVLMQMDRLDEAIPHLQKSAALVPAPATFGLLGNALIQKERVAEAAAAFGRAVALQPGNPYFHHNLGATLLQTGDTAGAVKEFEVSLKLGLDSPDALNDLAWLLATSPAAALRNGPRALALAQQAVQATGGREPVCLATLAAAQAETGQFSNAVETVQRALQVAGNNADPALTADLGGQLESYRAGKPYREDPRNPGGPTSGRP